MCCRQRNIFKFLKIDNLHCRGDEKKWIDAHYDPVANVHTFTQCICFSDIHADNDNKLVIADLGSGLAYKQIKLKVYKGANLILK